MRVGPQFNRLLKVAFLSAVAMTFHGALNGTAFANPIAIQVPTGLKTGDQFRIIFVTPGTTDATSPDIGTYDTFVNQQAGGATYNGQTIHWSAIGSTDSIGAKDHIGVTGAAVFMANGQEVAASDDSAGLWSGNAPLHDPSQDLAGNVYTGSIWTGTSGIGTEYYTKVPDIGDVTWGLGTDVMGVIDTGKDYSHRIEIGALNSNVSPYDWVSRGFGEGLQLRDTQLQMYGISDVLTVVPEPSSFLISGLGIVMIGLASKNRKRS